MPGAENELKLKLKTALGDNLGLGAIDQLSEMKTRSMSHQLEYNQMTRRLSSNQIMLDSELLDTLSQNG